MTGLEGIATRVNDAEAAVLATTPLYVAAGRGAPSGPPAFESDPSKRELARDAVVASDERDVGGRGRSQPPRSRGADRTSGRAAPASIARHTVRDACREARCPARKRRPPTGALRAPRCWRPERRRRASSRRRQPRYRNALSPIGHASTVRAVAVARPPPAMRTACVRHVGGIVSVGRVPARHSAALTNSPSRAR